MGQVVPIDRGKFLRYYVPGSRFQIIRGETFFALGVFGPIVVPQVAYCIFGGLLPPWVFVVVVQAGVIGGLIKFIWEATFAPLFDTQTTLISRNDSTRRRRVS